jgi:ppGpp synthetase/RelA/SpoT-type nucleotidyltranferase
MITPAPIINKYRQVESYLEPVRRKARDSLNILCEREGFALVSRVKTLESVAEKIETGRFENWSAIDDLVALTVIVPTLVDEEAVITFCDDVFERLILRARGSSKKPPEVFRFDCTRFIGRLRWADAEERPPMYHLPFEVQIRSAFEHAWAVTTHALTYKGPDVNWSKLRLTAQLKAAVEQLDTLVLAFSDTTEYIKPSDWPEIQAKNQIKSFFDGEFESGRLPAEHAPKDWSRFVDNVFHLIYSCTKRMTPTEFAAAVKKDVETEIKILGRDAIPRSISLWQLTLACLIKGGSLASKLKEHCPLITPELEELYPNLKTLATRFDYT